MDYVYFPIENSDIAAQLKSRLKELGVEARLFVDPISSFYPSQTIYESLMLAVSEKDLHQMSKIVDEFGLKAS